MSISLLMQLVISRTKAANINSESLNSDFSYYFTSCIICNNANKENSLKQLSIFLIQGKRITRGASKYRKLTIVN